MQLYYTSPKVETREGDYVNREFFLLLLNIYKNSFIIKSRSKAVYVIVN